MSYLHCHSCNFNQDDFWHKGYNPIKYLQDWTDQLFREDFYEDRGMDSNWKEEIGYGRDQKVTTQELLAHELERSAKVIREMRYRTLEEYRAKNPEGICPKCGKKDLDID